MKFDVILTATEEELLDGWQRARLRRASKGRLIVQSVLLAAVTVWSLVAYFGSGLEETASLLIGVAALLLIPVMWFVPAWQMKQTVKELAHSDTKPHLWVFEDGLDFGETEPEHAYFDFASVLAFAPKTEADLQTLVWRFRNDEVVVVPRRLLTEEQWAYLLTATHAMYD